MTQKIQTLFERLLEDKKLDLEELSWADYVCIDLDLILYKNEGLLNKAFSLLIRFHSQRKSLLDLLSSVQILESDEAIDTLHTIEDKVTELRKMAQNSEFWLGQTDRESVKTAKKTVDILEYLSELLVEKPADDESSDEERILKDYAKENTFLEFEEEKSSTSNSKQNFHTTLFILLDIEYPNSLNKKEIDKDLLGFANEEVDLGRPLPLDNEEPNVEYQRMLRNLDVHEIILIFVKQSSPKGIQSQALFHKVLKSGYSALIRFVRRNKSNQRCLIPYLDSVFKEQLGLGLGAVQLVGEISRDDSSLMQKGYSDFKDKVDVIESTPITSFLKSTHLHYLSVFMEFKEEPIVDNQIAVITELTQKDNTNIIHLFNSDGERMELSGIINQIAEDIESQLAGNKRRYVTAETPPTLIYVIELLNVMASATRGKNAITEVICQSLLPAPEFIKCFQEARFMYNYKIALLQFFIDTYLDIDKDVPTALQEDIWKLVSLLNDELDIFLRSTNWKDHTLPRCEGEAIHLQYFCKGKD